MVFDLSHSLKEQISRFRGSWVKFYIHVSVFPSNIILAMLYCLYECTTYMLIMAWNSKVDNGPR